MLSVIFLYSPTYMLTSNLLFIASNVCLVWFLNCIFWILYSWNFELEKGLTKLFSLSQCHFVCHVCSFGLDYLIIFQIVDYIGSLFQIVIFYGLSLMSLFASLWSPSYFRELQWGNLVGSQALGSCCAPTPTPLLNSESYKNNGKTA